MRHVEVTKSLWVYIKKNKLNQGREITPDAKLKKVFPVAKSARLDISIRRLSSTVDSRITLKREFSVYGLY